MTYYHFIRVNEDEQAYLGYDDNRIVTVGEPVTVGGTPVLCQHGLHASKRILDALGYCPEREVALCRVELGGEVLHDTDKSVASERTIIAMLDEKQTAVLLQDFARWCALQVIDLWDAPDVVRQYLTTGDETLRADAWLASERAVWASAAASRAAREAAAEAAAAEAAAAARASARADAAARVAAAAAASASAAAASAASAAAASARVESKQAQEEKLVQLFEAAGGGVSHDIPAQV